MPRCNNNKEVATNFESYPDTVYSGAVKAGHSTNL